MDSTTFREAVLADYIVEMSGLSRDELLQEVIELKSLVLESASDTEVLQQNHEQKRRHFTD